MSCDEMKKNIMRLTVAMYLSNFDCIFLEMLVHKSFSYGIYFLFVDEIVLYIVLYQLNV
jgi:hypothetical protein